MPSITIRVSDKLYRKITDRVPDGENKSKVLKELIEIGIAAKENHYLEETIAIKEEELDTLKENKKLRQAEINGKIASKQSELEFYFKLKEEKEQAEHRKIKVKENKEFDKEEAMKDEERQIKARIERERKRAFEAVESQCDLKNKLLSREECTREVEKDFSLEYWNRRNEHGKRIRINRDYIGDYWRAKMAEDKNVE